MKKLLWVDDERDPFENNGHWLAYAPFITNDVVWVKSYDEFVSWIIENGLPDGISFDHDLGDTVNPKEKTGFECAKWLVDYCLDNDSTLPEFTSQSSNPAGRKNILGLLNNFKKYNEI